MPAVFTKPTELELVSLQREPIKKFSDMKAGDHLVRHSSLLGKHYLHHFLCTGVKSDGQPTIIHYHNTRSNGSSRSILASLSGWGCSGGKLASIKEITLPHKDFIKNESELQKKGVEVERVVWPDELKFYPDQEVVKRARERLGEEDYDLETNNCESFIMWCKCGMNISLQSASPSVRIPSEVLKGLIMAVFQLCGNILKITVDIVEQALGRSCLGNAIAKYGTESLSVIGCTVGLVFALVIDVASLVYDIRQAKQKWRKGLLIETKEEFIKEVVGLVITSSFRSIGSVAGMFFGQMFIPVPVGGAIIGTFIGSGLGFGLGKFVSWLCSKRIASALEKRCSSYHPNLGAFIQWREVGCQVGGGVHRRLVMRVAQ
ncbi:Hypothetical predicted protein [Paramuricea clavata]|uniref:Uncharacterized protein n=1 Tax=Paramuricea clavata TaxID=317549 RepID=A0A6S7K392_PARCT|nr:Hypothetical predicted protein [Paramuricea clavata]